MGVKGGCLFPGMAGEWENEGDIQVVFYIHMDQLAQAYVQLNNEYFPGCRFDKLQ